MAGGSRSLTRRTLTAWYCIHGSAATSAFLSDSPSNNDLLRNASATAAGVFASCSVRVRVSADFTLHLYRKQRPFLTLFHSAPKHPRAAQSEDSSCLATKFKNGNVGRCCNVCIPRTRYIAAIPISPTTPSALVASSSPRHSSTTWRELIKNAKRVLSHTRTQCNRGTSYMYKMPWTSWRIYIYIRRGWSYPENSSLSTRKKKKGQRMSLLIVMQLSSGDEIKFQRKSKKFLILINA